MSYNPMDFMYIGNFLYKNYSFILWEQNTTHLRGDGGHLSARETLYSGSVLTADVTPMFQVRNLSCF